jgi:hypothetical protein
MVVVRQPMISELWIPDLHEDNSGRSCQVRCRLMVVFLYRRSVSIELGFFFYSCKHRMLCKYVCWLITAYLLRDVATQ